MAAPGGGGGIARSQVADDASADFGERFEVTRRLGAGGMGVVYEAFDRERKARVALKTMRSIDASDLYRFKNEFRALTDVLHPNLVALHELLTHGTTTFFTMELVDGEPLLSHVRRDAVVAQADTIDASSRDPNAAQRATPRRMQASACDFDRLRVALLQLARGIVALHEAGKLHRDIKPSNVIVARDGRVVLLDFGLVMSIDEGEAIVTRERFAGTPEYMSPEQAGEAELGPASDWYAFGVVLFEALTGDVPFHGPPLKLMLEKQQTDSPRAGGLVSGIPADLDTLCAQLLTRDPEKRPKGRAILALLGDADSSQQGAPRLVSRVSKSTLEAPFLGREEAMRTLDEVFETTLRGGAAVAFVHGASGMGKSALVRRYLEGISLRSNALVLTGRCYDNESVPYKALDSVIDAVSRHLRRLSRDQCDALLPLHATALARLFPVLARVDATVMNRRRGVAQLADPQEVRRRAFSAFRELFDRMAAQRPLVVWIDDLQWGDLDSAAILADLLRPPDVPPLLLIGTYRTEDAERSPLLRALLDPETRIGAEVRSIELQVLSRDESEELVIALFGDDGPALRAQARRIAVESQGIPFFVDELVRHMQSGAGLRESQVAQLRLDDALRARIETFPTDARRLLRAVAVAARPIQLGIALRAAGVAPEAEAAAVGVLRTGHLVRTSRAGGGTSIETYHDRIRESVVDAFEPDALVEVHAHLAEAYADAGSPDPEALLPHLLGAGDEAAAAEQAERAGDRATLALAFDRAAHFYEVVLRLGGGDASARRAWFWKLGDALANAGRGGEAATAYIAAVEGAPVGDVLELRRRAAEQLLRSGRFEEGIGAMRTVLGEVGIEFPKTPLTALLALLWYMFLVRLGRLRFVRRDLTQLAPEEVRRIDVCWSVNSTLSLVDPIRALAFQKQHVLRALRSGEPFRVARALATETVSSALRGPKNAVRTEAIRAKAAQVAEESGHPNARALVLMCTGMALFLEGRAKDARPVLEQARQRFRDECTGVALEVGMSETFLAWSLWRLGEVREVVRRVSLLLQEAHERGDLALGVNLRVGLTNAVWLVDDDPERALLEAVHASQRLHGHVVPLQTNYETIAKTNVALYRGDAKAAWELVSERFPQFRRAMLFRVQNVHLEACHLRARSALAWASKSNERARCLAVARSDATVLARSRIPWAIGVAHLVRAGIDAAVGSKASAIEHLRTAIPTLQGQQMAMYVAAARRALGGLVGGDEGEVELRAARAYFDREGIRAPERMARLIVTGIED